MNLLFMGTPDYAAECLKKIYAHAGCHVVGVVTQPDKPRGRGMKLVPSPVKDFALSVGVPVYQPETLRREVFEDTLSRIAPEIIVVAAYGKILPHYVISYPKYGCINAHASLLPKYRGAAPINRAIMHGESKTGITAIYMDDGIDTGDIILKLEVPIEDRDNAGTLHDKLAALSGEAMVQAIDLIETGRVTRTTQTDEGSSYAHKITKEDCRVDFTLPAHDVLNLIRGLSPYPGAVTKTPDGKLLKITSARISCTFEKVKATNGNSFEPSLNSDTSDCNVGSGSPLSSSCSICSIATEHSQPDKDPVCGEIVSLEGGEISVACADGIISICNVIPEGKASMSAGDYIRGRKIKIGDILKFE